MNPDPNKALSSKIGSHVTSNVRSFEVLSPSDHMTNREALGKNCQAKSQLETDNKVEGCTGINLTCQKGLERDCQDQPKPEAKTELELMYDKIRVKKDKNVQIHCSQKVKKKIQKDVVNSPRSINEVLRYNSRESPIMKKSSSKVKMMVKDLENPGNNDPSRPKVKSLKKRLKKNVKTDVGALQNQPQISTFFGKK